MQALAQHLSDELAPTLLEYRAKHGLREQLGSVKMGEGGAELSQATYLKDIFGSFDRPDIEWNWSGEPDGLDAVFLAVAHFMQPHFNRAALPIGGAQREAPVKTDRRITCKLTHDYAKQPPPRVQ